MKKQPNRVGTLNMYLYPDVVFGKSDELSEASNASLSRVCKTWVFAVSCKLDNSVAF